MVESNSGCRRRRLHVQVVQEQVAAGAPTLLDQVGGHGDGLWEAVAEAAHSSDQRALDSILAESSLEVHAHLGTAEAPQLYPFERPCDRQPASVRRFASRPRPRRARERSRAG